MTMTSDSFQSLKNAMANEAIIVAIADKTCPIRKPAA